VRKTEPGKEWLEKEDGKLWNISDTEDVHDFYTHVPKTWDVISAGGGRILNIVSPKANGARTGSTSKKEKKMTKSPTIEKTKSPAVEKTKPPAVEKTKPPAV
jgi:hypothetical protein